MMCYRDRTYCTSPCAAAECSRRFTDEIEDAANRTGLPLALGDLARWCKKYVAPSPDPGGER